MTELTIVAESVKSNVVRGVSEIKEASDVPPALDDDAAFLPVERKVGSVDVARSLRHAGYPPVDSAVVVHLGVELVQVLQEEGVDAKKHEIQTTRRYTTLSIHCCLIKLLPYISFEKYFSIGNGQLTEPALYQLYRHTFVAYAVWEFCKTAFRTWKNCDGADGASRMNGPSGAVLALQSGNAARNCKSALQLIENIII